MVTVIGAGLAGCEAAWQLAQRHIPVHLYEMRPGRMTPAHTSDRCGELVCSNSLRSDDAERNAVGLLHEEMRRLDSLIMAAADRHRLPAGTALAVDREGFANWLTDCMRQHPYITLIRDEVTALPEQGWVIVASGPLTSSVLAEQLQRRLGSEQLAFFDAIAPIVALESINFDIAWRQSRYGHGNGDDYINCPLDQQQYEQFIDALLSADKVTFKPFEQAPYFEGCLPIEVMAERGRQTPRFGPMKPVGLNNPHQGGQPAYAVVQLRQDNQLGTLWNMVGFQTKLTWSEQQRLFRTIPGLEQAEFYRLGAMHRNTFINSPQLLTSTLQLKSDPRLLFAGQMIGVEGYVESAAMGLLAGLFLAQLYNGHEPLPPPITTAHGALLAHVTAGATRDGFQPMNVNFGLFPPLDPPVGKRWRQQAMSRRALEALQQWIFHAPHPPTPSPEGEG
ncbi:MAG: methylenetetrahydrofolate--tRNA-(uracil(54)-C(5))-methyltransferase (FADH(2)-oxidizing) TrmFO [Magnetococcales bacterium]|nr:methylenetetrahydrofolate--tRNA-(uracil(54)-C(5))-methyltransferase (FADH(2)-oxidizing) TrmFO [Magnetococcales bacterium]